MLYSIVSITKFEDRKIVKKWILQQCEVDGEIEISLGAQFAQIFLDEMLGAKWVTLLQPFLEM